MSFKDRYLQFVHLVTKNAVVASLTMFLAVGTLSASAAEVFAPNDYKPSTISKNIFNTNKQPDKDPYTALRTDDNNYVANLKACDISIKFPKQINGTNVEVYTDQRYQENTLINYFTLVDAYEFSPQYASQISRDEKPSIAFNSFNLNCGNFKTKFGEDYTQTKLTTDQLRNKTSWFVTENELSDIYDITGNFNSRVYEYKTILFTHKDIEYRIDYADPNYKGSDKQDLPGIFTNQIQIQFNSLVQNQDNKAVTEIPTKAGIQKNTPNIEPTVNPIKIELQKQGKLIKSENIIAQAQDDNGNPQVCGVKYVISYNDPIIDNERNDFNSMSVTNNNLGFNLEQKTDYRNILGLLQRKIIYPDKNNYSRPQTSASSFLTPFLNSCGGDPFSYKFLEAPQVNYANTDSSITLYTLEGNGETGIPTVRIFAKKGDDLITISKTLFGYPYDLVAAECTIKTADGERIDNACYENALKRDPKLKTLLDAAAKDLVQTFAIKN